MKKVLITGGKGFFASRLAEFYRDKFDILVLNHNDLDVVDENKVNDKWKEFRPEYVIHTAAITVTDFCNKNPEKAYSINVNGAVNVAKATKAVNGKLIFISTEQVFNGNENDGPYAEEDIAIPDTVYGQNKLEAEGLLKQIIEQLWIVRFTWMFGMPVRNCNMSGNILWETLSAIIKNEKIVVSPNEYRGMTDVYEMVENFAKIFDIPYGIYHLGSANEKSRYEIIKLIFNELGLEHRFDELVVEDKEKYILKKRDIRLDTKKAKNVGIEFENTTDAIKRCIKEYGIRL